MARPRRCRRICMEPEYDCFVPSGISNNEIVLMTIDEYEAIRLIDLEKYTHEQCAAQMDVSRTTVTEMYETARYKIADCLTNGKTLRIVGGSYRLCNGTAAECCHRNCLKTADFDKFTQIKFKEADHIRIAVPCENGIICPHFGHSEQFKLYDVKDDRIVNVQTGDTKGQGHGALVGFLMQATVDALICGGIGGAAQTALAEAGIRLLGGVSGPADEAVMAYIDGDLNYSTKVNCSHCECRHLCGNYNCNRNSRDRQK
ncbi:DUF134 domain-containing protein [Huintestinicola sp.]|uniref:DUF134 domain-containing protein n=1 Tax=Huintestinicola sp. TaxID=2981661 RepID=UPI003D7DF7FA